MSVVILNYNGHRFVERCLQSVLLDSYCPKEILFVDNASSDGSIQLAYPFQDRITIRKNSGNFGFPKGCNQGIRIARGEIIVLLNIDTEVCEGWLSELVAPFIDNPKMGLVGSKLLFPDSQRIQFAGGIMEANGLTQHRGYGRPDDGSYDTPCEVEYLTGASVAIRREVLDRLGGMDEGFPLYFEDLDLCNRARQAGYSLLYQPASVVYHFETYGTRKQSFRYFFKYHRGRIRFIVKNFGLRYFIRSFIPYERDWYRRCGIRQQAFPLLAAYITQLPKAPYFWLKGYLRRRISQ